MKTEVIDLLRNNKLKKIAINSGDVDQVISICKKVGSKSNSDDFAQAALIWELRGDLQRSIESSKKALASIVVENNPIDDRKAGVWGGIDQATQYEKLLPSMKANVENVFGEGSFESISLHFKNSY